MHINIRCLIYLLAMRRKKRKKKKSKKHPRKSVVQHNMTKIYKHRNAITTTILTLLGIYVSFVVLLFTKDGDVLDNLFLSLSSIGGLYVNLIAVISVAYSKFAKEILVHCNVFWLSVASFVIIVSIFAQAKGMIENSISPEWIQTPYISIALQMLLAFLIYLIAQQKELNIRITYNKIKIS